MCGLVGFIDYRYRTTSEDLAQMSESLDHRGPDSTSQVVADIGNCLIGLAHKRLAILDLSIAGTQPMAYLHLTIVYNGEIYNYREVRDRLIKVGHVFNTESDTEVILHAYEEWGEKCVDHFIGMFAIAIFDRKHNKLILIKDRFGVKPLYFFWKNGTFLFASELKSLHRCPSFEAVVDNSSLAAFFDFGYVPTPNSIFCDTYKLKPGHFLIFDIITRNFITKAYWKSSDYLTREKLQIDYEEAKAHLHELLKSAYSYRMVADVPVGLFLSGGYDSTSVAAILQSELTSRLRTYTIGFHQGNNEAPVAKSIATILGTDHHEYYCTEREAMDIIPQLPYYFDEPFADSSAIPTMLISKITGASVKVALSADGGDEIFYGYESYSKLLDRLNLMKSVPKFIRSSVGSGMQLFGSILPERFENLKHRIDGVSQSYNRNNLIMAREIFIRSRTLPSTLRKRLSIELKNGNEIRSEGIKVKYDNEVDLVSDIDIQSYLLDDILVKVDRATMSASLEGREPILDHRLFEFVSQLPVEYKIHNNKTKRILKDIVHSYLPVDLMNRPKTGFSLPIYSWLRSELREYVSEYLSVESLSKSGYINSKSVFEKVKAFKQDRFHYKPFIWRLLMFQLWYERWSKNLS